MDGTKGNELMATTCNCKASTAQDLTTRPVQGDVYEVGIKCPKCGVFTHSHFYSKELENLHDTRGKSTTYQKVFDKLQQEHKDKIQ